MPVPLERAYKPTGWLLQIFKSQLYFDYREEETLQQTAAKIADFVVTLKREKAVEKYVANLPLDRTPSSFKTIGIPKFSKSKYFKREQSEIRLLMQIKNVSNNPRHGCLLIYGERGVGKTTLISHLLTDSKNFKFFENECQINRLIWINCLEWRQHFDEKAFMAKLLQFANEIELRQTRHSTYFTSCQSLNAYLKMKELRLAFVLDNFNVEILNFINRTELGFKPCIAITHEAPVDYKKVQKNECIEPMADEDVRELVIARLRSRISDFEIVGLVKQCCGLPLLGGLVASRIANCHLEGVHNEYSTLMSPHTSLVTTIFNLTLDQLDPSLRPLFYAFLIFNPNDQISIVDLGILWGFDVLDECGTRGICRAFEKRCLIRRLRRLNEDHFSIHHLIFEAAIQKAKNDYKLQGDTNEDLLSTLRYKVVNGELMGSEEREFILTGAVKGRRRQLLERIIAELEPGNLSQLCMTISPIDGVTFLQFLYHFPWDLTPKRWNASYQLLKQFLVKIEEGSWELLERTVTKSQLKSRCSCVLIDILDDAKNPCQLRQRSSLLAYLHRLVPVYLEMKWEGKLFEDGSKTDPIVFAVFEGNLDLARRLSASCLDKTVQGQCCQVAARRGNLPILKFLVEKWGQDIVKTQDLEGQVPLVGASRNGHLNTVRYLCDIWPDGIKVVDSNGRSATLWAAKHGHVQTVQYLHGIDPSITKLQDFHGVSTLMAAAGEGHFALMKFLVENLRHQLLDLRGRRGEEDSALSIAASYGRLDVVKYLLPRYSTHHLPKVFAVACATGHDEIVKFMLEECPKIGQEMAGDAKMTPLMIAASCGHLETVKVLQGHCDDFVRTAKSGSKVTAMMAAARNGHNDVVQWLFYNIPNSAYVEMADGESALTIAERMGHGDIAQFLKDNTKA